MKYLFVDITQADNFDVKMLFHPTETGNKVIL